MARRKREPISEGKKNIIAQLIEEYDIKTAGVEDILIACTDNLTVFSQAIVVVFPKTDI